MAAVMIGVDPHKGSHTAVAIDQAEMALGEVRVRASAAQVQQLLGWAQAWPERTWAIEGAGGLGHLLAQQLVAAGEQVLDVKPAADNPDKYIQAIMLTAFIDFGWAEKALRSIRAYTWGGYPRQTSYVRPSPGQVESMKAAGLADLAHILLGSWMVHD